MNFSRETPSGTCPNRRVNIPQTADYKHLTGWTKSPREHRYVTKRPFWSNQPQWHHLVVQSVRKADILMVGSSGVGDMDTMPSTMTGWQLTGRQADCVKLVAQGLSSKEVARYLGISPSTVDNHIAAVVIKYRLRDRRQLVQLCRHHDDLEKIELQKMLFNFSEIPENSFSQDNFLKITRQQHNKNYKEFRNLPNSFPADLRYFLYLLILLIIVGLFYRI